MSFLIPHRLRGSPTLSVTSNRPRAFGGAASLTSNGRERWSIPLVPAGHIDAAQPRAGADLIPSGRQASNCLTAPRISRAGSAASARPGLPTTGKGLVSGSGGPATATADGLLGSFGVLGVSFRGRTRKGRLARTHPGRNADENGCEEKVIFGVILVHRAFTPARLMLVA